MALCDILVFEDDVSIANLMLDILHTAGYSVKHVPTAQNALSMAQQFKPRLVVMDIMMPGLDGVSACKMLRSDAGLKGLRVLVCSSKTAALASPAALRAGADLFLPKPFAMEDLLHAVSSLIAGPSAAAADPEQETVAVKFLGCRSAGTTSCVLVKTRSTLISLDAGSGLERIGADLDGRGELTVLLTHYHPDHTSGLKSLASRKIDLSLYGPNDIDVSLKDVAGSLLGPEREHVALFPIEEGALEIGLGVHLSALYVNHPGTTLALKVELHGVKIVYCPDNSLAPFGTPPTDMDRRIKNFTHGADLLIHDARYAPQDSQDRSAEGHSKFPAVVELAIDAGVKRLALFHLDSSYSEDKLAAIENAAQEQVAAQITSLDVFLAREGLEVNL